MSAHRPHALTLVAGAAAIALGLAACGGGNTTAGTAQSAATTATATTAATPAAGPPPPRGRILYTDETTGRDQVWVVGSDGTGLHALRAMDGEQAHPGWAPDGRRVVFARDLERGGGLYLMRPDGTRVTPLAGGRNAGDPSFSRDGRWIVFTRDVSERENGLAIIPAGGGTPRRVTTNPEHGGAGGGECGCDVDARFTPDGRHIVFQRLRHDETDSAIFIVGRDGRGLRRLTDWKLAAGLPRVSPDGRLIAYSTNTNESGEVANVWVMGLDGAGARQLTRQADGGGTFAGSWSPDGRWLSVTSDRARGKPHIWVMRADGSGARDLTPVANGAHASDWGG